MNDDLLEYLFVTGQLDEEDKNYEDEDNKEEIDKKKK